MKIDIELSDEAIESLEAGNTIVTKTTDHRMVEISLKDNMLNITLQML